MASKPITKGLLIILNATYRITINETKKPIISTSAHSKDNCSVLVCKWEWMNNRMGHLQSMTQVTSISIVGLMCSHI